MSATHVGGAVRARRREAGHTLAALATRSGLSAPFLSQVENDRARPSLASLQRIADALGTTAVELLAGAEGGPGPVDTVRSSDGTALAQADGPSREEVRPLVRGARQLQAMEFTGGRHDPRTFVHRNDELMYVVRGEARAEVDGEERRLGPGDALYCAGGVRHSWRPLTEDTTVLLVAVSERARVTLEP